MYTVFTQLFPELGPGVIGQFDNFDDALAFALNRFQFGADTWVEEDGFAIVTATELEWRFRAENPLA